MLGTTPDGPERAWLKSMAANAQIARRLEEVAELLYSQGANPYRVSAYRRAAITISQLHEPVDALFAREGIDGLRRLPGIGDRLAIAIRTLLLTGRLPMLEHLRGETDPVALLRSVPGVGPIHADRLHHDLGIDTLEDLEAAAHDGRLVNLAGFGAKRVAGIIDSLATRLGRLRRPVSEAAERATVEELLDVDREYRQAVQKGTLTKIAPRRFNPKGEAWLPILHTQRGDRHYTALYSNTALAHKLGRTSDWVILYHDGPSGDQQHTVITGRDGPFAGRRIVRGREKECAEYYRSREPQRTDPSEHRDSTLRS